jgi:hypothetical protein
MQKALTNIAVVGLLLVGALGCSQLTKKTAKDAVPKEQINQDLAVQKLPAAGGPEWDFSQDSMRCFQLFEHNSTVSDSEVKLELSVAAIQGDMRAKLGSGSTLNTLFGKVRAIYKKQGDKWVVDKVSPIELSQKRLGEDAFSKFFEITAPVCSYFEHKK